MDINWRKGNHKWIAEVWSSDASEPLVEQGFKEPYPEETYAEINQWCMDTLGYRARTAYHIFEFRNQTHLNWFLLKWS